MKVRQEWRNPFVSLPVISQLLGPCIEWNWHIMPSNIFLFNIFLLTKFLYIFQDVYRHINEVFRPYSLKKYAWERSKLENEIFSLSATSYQEWDPEVPLIHFPLKALWVIETHLALVADIGLICYLPFPQRRHPLQSTLFFFFPVTPLKTKKQQQQNYYFLWGISPSSSLANLAESEWTFLYRETEIWPHFLEPKRHKHAYLSIFLEWTELPFLLVWPALILQCLTQM